MKSEINDTFSFIFVTDFKYLNSISSYTRDCFFIIVKVIYLFTVIFH